MTESPSASGFQGSDLQGSAFWDAKFEGDAYAYGTAPNAFLASKAHLVRAGDRVLVPGDGEGRNGVFLAKQGADVTTLDLSSLGIDKAKRLAHREGVGLDAHRADLFAWNWPDRAYDAVVLVFLHMPPEKRRWLHAKAAAALKPGGRLIIEGFSKAHTRHQAKSRTAGGPQREDMLFTAGDLREDFGALTVMHLQEVETTLDEGPLHSGPASLVRAVFVKPG